MESYESVSMSPSAHIETNQLWTVGYDGKVSLPLEINIQDVQTKKTKQKKREKK